MSLQNPQPLQTNDESKELLSFTLGGVEYGIDILKVREIRGYDSTSVTPVANTPTHVKGIINLRGVIVPIIDLRIRFKLDCVKYDGQTVVVILNIDSHIVGIVVDGVSDVMRLQPAQIGQAPHLGSDIATRYLMGVATFEARMLLLVDIDQLMSQDELGRITEVIA